jgi:hypothetical protein
MIYNLGCIPAVAIARTASSPLPVVTLAHIVDSSVRSDVNEMDGWVGEMGRKAAKAADISSKSSCKKQVHRVLYIGINSQWPSHRYYVSRLQQGDSDARTMV